MHAASWNTLMHVDLFMQQRIPCRVGKLPGWKRWGTEVHAGGLALGASWAARERVKETMAPLVELLRVEV